MPPLLVVPGTKITAADLTLLNVMFTTGAQNVTGVKTFQAAATPVLLADPAVANQAARRGYIDARNYIVVFPTDDLRALLQGATAGDRFWLQPGNHLIAASINVTAADVVIHGTEGAVIAGQAGVGAGNPVIDINADNVRIEGVEVSVTTGDGIRVNAGRIAVLRDVHVTGGANGVIVSGAGHVIIDDCFLDTNTIQLYSNAAPVCCVEVTGTRFNGGRIDLPDNTNITIDSCFMNGCYIVAATAGTGFRVVDSVLYNILNGIGISVAGSNYVVAGNTVLMNVAAAFAAILMAGTGTVYGNTISTYDIGIHLNGTGLTAACNTVTLNGDAVGIRCQTGRCVVVYNTLKVANGNATNQSVIQVNGTAPGAMIVHNYIDASLQTPAGAKTGIEVQQNANNSQVVGNQVTNTSNNNSFQRSIYVRALYCRVTDNVVENMGRNNAYCIYMDNEYMTVINNNLRMMDGYGIYCEYGRCQIQGNFMYAALNAADGGFIVNGAETEIQLAGNYIDTGGVPAITFNAASTRCMMTDNQYRGTATVPAGAGCIVADNLNMP